MDQNINVKQVILIRDDLNMRKGKMCAQSAHASLMVILKNTYLDDTPDEIRPTGSLMKSFAEWMKTGQTKICLKVESEEQLLNLYRLARIANLPCSLVVDEGRTEFKGVPTPTAVAIGPADADDIDKITGGLKLL